MLFSSKIRKSFFKTWFYFKKVANVHLTKLQVKIKLWMANSLSQLSEDVSVIYMTPKEGSRKEGPVPAPRSPGHISAQHSSHKSSSRNSARKSRSSNRTNPEGILGSLHDYDPLRTVHV